MKNIIIDKKQNSRKKLCTLSLIISIIITVLFLIFSVAPLLSAAVGIFIYLMLGIGAVIITICSLGFVWIDEDFRNRWKGAFDFANKLMNNGIEISSVIGNKIIWISIIIFIVSSFGFVTNLISFCKYRDNKSKLIVSTIFLSISFVCLTFADIVYLTYR